jgi:hypothetical protein
VSLEAQKEAKSDVNWRKVVVVVMVVVVVVVT